MIARRLFLSRVTPDFDPDADIALGPWCFIGAEQVFPDWENLSFDCPYEDEADVIADDRKAARLMNHLAFVWAERLNVRHRRQYSVLFWRTLLALWLTAAIQASWQRWRHIENRIARLKDKPLTLTVAGAAPGNDFADLAAFMSALENDRAGILDNWLSSLIVKRLHPASWTLTEDTGPAAPSVTSQPNLAKRTLAGKIANFLFGRLPFNHVHGVRLWKIAFSLMVHILPRRPSPRPNWENDETVRNEFPAAYLDVLDTFLEGTIPRAYGDDFTHWESLALTQKYVPGRLLVDHIIPMDPKNQFVIAMATEKGERLVGTQHGAMTGTSAAAFWTSEAAYRHFAFISWGWSRHGGFEGNFVPLPSPYLSRFRNRHAAKTGHLIIVSTKIGINGTRFDSTPNPEQWIQHRKMKVAFLQALKKNVLDETYYRPYLRSTPNLDETGYLTTAFPELKVLDGDLHKAMLRCRLLVLDHPGTTLNVAMAANVPLVCYWNPKAWPLCPEAEPFFHALRQCGILFDDPVAASRHINKIWGDIPGWWNSVDVQNARRGWAESFARSSSIWWWHWARAIYNLAS